MLEGKKPAVAEDAESPARKKSRLSTEESPALASLIEISPLASSSLASSPQGFGLGEDFEDFGWDEVLDDDMKSCSTRVGSIYNIPASFVAVPVPQKRFDPQLEAKALPQPVAKSIVKRKGAKEKKGL